MSGSSPAVNALGNESLVFFFKLPTTTYLYDDDNDLLYNVILSLSLCDNVQTQQR